MKISLSRPPVWDACHEAFDLSNSKPAFTFGDTIYNPHQIVIPADLMVHEEVHGEQMQHNNDVAVIWWKKYIADPAFRIEQELEAYSAQYDYLCKQTTDRERRFKYRHQIALALSGPIYGNAISYKDALYKLTALQSRKTTKVVHKESSLTPPAVV